MTTMKILIVGIIALSLAIGAVGTATARSSNGITYRTLPGWGANSVYPAYLSHFKPVLIPVEMHSQSVARSVYYVDSTASSGISR